MKNMHPRKMIKTLHSLDFWQCPLVGDFKINFNGAGKGNLGPVGFGGAIRDSSDKILSMFWGNMGTSTNNLVELKVSSMGCIGTYNTSEIH